HLQEWRAGAVRRSELPQENAMDQIKPVADLSIEEVSEQQNTRDADVRKLSELELALCGGGDGMTNW
ncbi:MAG TPA: hypothetical protein VM051_06610, partial [Usitatibacter sp.]|nr:hypothetical protein [Usitatibacter sp.]